MTDTIAPAIEPTVTPPRTRPVWPGILSLAFGILTVAGLITGIVLATGDLYLAATYAAWAACGAAVLAVLMGVLALIVRRARAWAVAGIVLGVVACPPLLTAALGGIARLW
ncbi:MAG: hypothetical protein ABI566_09115 [Pseudolysinimonas sp.]